MSYQLHIPGTDASVSTEQLGPALVSTLYEQKAVFLSQEWNPHSWMVQLTEQLLHNYTDFLGKEGHEQWTEGKGKAIPLQSSTGPWGFQEVEVPRFQDSRHKQVVRLLLLWCRTAGYKSVSGRSCDRPSRHRFFLVSLGPRANAEMVPAFTSCLYMLLM